MCNTFSTNTNFCCFLSGAEEINNNRTLCLEFSMQLYYGQKTINYYQNSYNIDCGIGSTNSDEKTKCGNITSPKKPQDCFAFSDDSQSCCYYSYQNISTCYWLGDKYFGETILKDMILSCHSGFNRLYIIFLIVYIYYDFFKKRS